MKLALISVLIMTLVGCSVAPKSKVGSDEQKKDILKSVTATKPKHRAIYFYRDRGTWGNYTLAVFINKKWIGSLKAEQFTKIELPYGKYFFEGSFNAVAPSEFEPYKKASPVRKKIIQKLMTREFLVNEETPDPVIMRLESEFIDPEEEEGPAQYTDIFRHPIEYGGSVVKKITQKSQYVLPEENVKLETWISKKDREEWELYSETTSISSLNNFIRDNPNNFYIKEAKKKRDELKRVQDAEYAEAKKRNTLDSYSKFISNNPGTPHRGDAFKRMTKKMKSRSIYEEYADIFPGIIDYYPSSIRYDMALMELGPRNMKIRDILNLKKEGLGVRTISAKIEATNAPYKDFSVKEIKHLKKRGVDESLIEAMIKSNTEYHRQMKAAKQNKEMMAQIAKLIAETKNSTTVKATTKEEKNMPIECLKLKAALKACEATGGFLAMACETTARASFECNIKI